MLDQQAIRQKVREVSARQQSIHNPSEDERHPHLVPESDSVSPYSGSEGRLGQPHIAKKAELNTQHIREIRREAEKQRDLAQNRIQNHHLSNKHNIIDENLRLGHNLPLSARSIDENDDSDQYLLHKANAWDGDMAFHSAKHSDGPSTRYSSPRAGYNSSDLASLRYTGSPVPLTRQQGHLPLPSTQVPSAMSVENNTDSRFHSSPAGTIRSSSTDTPTPSRYLDPGQLHATSPAFSPAKALELALTLHTNEHSKSSLPSVKGTERLLRNKTSYQRPSPFPGAWENKKEHFDLSETNSFTKPAATQAGFRTFNKPNEETINLRKKTRESTVVAAGAAGLRDPMPYTGFSKKDQLYERFKKTIDETTAKGDLSASNRSVLYDPGASTTTAVSNYGSLSNLASSNTTSSNTNSRRQKIEGMPSVHSQSICDWPQL